MSEYEKYKLQWMMEHDYSIKNLVDELTAHQYADPEDSDHISTPVNELFAKWERDIGFGSEIWACEAEWLECKRKELEHNVRVESLGGIYAVDALYYWCNGGGEINLPGDFLKPYRHNTADDLPSPELQELYNDYWKDSCLCTEYVVTLDRVNGFLFCYLLSDEWLQSVGIHKESLFEMVQEAAGQIFAVPELSGCRFLYGEDTAPDGSEFQVFFPYEKRACIPKFRADLNSGNFDLFTVITTIVPF